MHQKCINKGDGGLRGIYNQRYGRVGGMGAGSVRSTASFNCVCESLWRERSSELGSALLEMV